MGLRTSQTSASSPASTSTATAPKMEVRGLSKTFNTRGGTVGALESCDLSVATGEFVTIVGPSGCGKSTLMTIAAGLDEPTTGQVYVDGTIAGPPGPQRSVVFQAFALFPSQTVRQNIEFGLRVAKVDRAEREQRLSEQLELMGLEQFRNSYPHELSGGMKQRVAIARALLQEEVSRLHRVMNYTVLFITHSVEEAVYLADRVVVMTKRPGRIKKEIKVPRDVEWRTRNIEDAMSFTEFNEIRQEVWGLVREEISRS